MPLSSGVRLRSGAPDIDPEAVQDAIQNPHDCQIIAMAQSGEVSAQDIISETGIPKSTVYRRLDHLQEVGLLVVTGGTMRKGHPIDLYSSRLDMAGLRVEDGEIQAEWKAEESADERLYRLWKQLGSD